MTVLDVIVEALARAGAGRLFAVRPSEPLLAAARTLDVVSVADATAACVMAAATGELTGVPGAAALDAPASDALALALAERSPLVCLGPPAGDILAGAVKATIDVTPASAAHWAAHAVHLALAWPRGPVYLALGDVAGAPAVPLATSVRPPAPASTGDLDRVAAAIRAAERPVVLTGIAARDASARSWVRAFAESLPAPVVTTWKAKGTLPDPHPLAFGVPTASTPAAELFGRADLLIALGVDDAEHDGIPEPARAVWLGPGAADIAGDVGAILGDLASRLAGARGDWDVADLDRRKRRLDVRSDGRVRRLVALAREAMPVGTIATFDARLREAAASWDCVTPDDVLLPARASLPGFALPAAVAAALATPAAAVLCFTDAVDSASAQAALAIARDRGLALGMIVTGGARRVPDAIGVAGETALAMALGRLLSERRPLVLAAEGVSDRPV